MRKMCIFMSLFVLYLFLTPRVTLEYTSNLLTQSSVDLLQGETLLLVHTVFSSDILKWNTSMFLLTTLWVR